MSVLKKKKKIVNVIYIFVQKYYNINILFSKLRYLNLLLSKVYIATF